MHALLACVFCFALLQTAEHAFEAAGCSKHDQLLTKQQRHGSNPSIARQALATNFKKAAESVLLIVKHSPFTSSRVSCSCKPLAALRAAFAPPTTQNSAAPQSAQRRLAALISSCCCPSAASWLPLRRHTLLGPAARSHSSDSGRRGRVEGSRSGSDSSLRLSGAPGCLSGSGCPGPGIVGSSGLNGLHTVYWSSLLVKRSRKWHALPCCHSESAEPDQVSLMGLSFACLSSCPEMPVRRTCSLQVVLVVMHKLCGRLFKQLSGACV